MDDGGLDMSHGEQTDEALVSAYRQGDLAAFEALVRRYEKELYLFLARFVRDRAAAEDIFQDTFIQVHHSLDSFDVDRRFRAWLFTIAGNKARDHLRKAKRQFALPLSASVDGGVGGGNGGEGSGGGRAFVDLMAGDWATPTEEVAGQEMAELVREVVSTLPEHLREILVLSYFHQFPYKEIASMLEIPLGTVKSRLHAAVGTFAELWKARFGDEQEAVGRKDQSGRSE